MVVAQRFNEIAGGELHVVELGEVKNMRFGKHGSRDIQSVANFRQILEKMRVSQLFGVFVYELFTDMTVRYQFSPNSHIRIIHETGEKVNRLRGNIRNFLHIRYSEKKRKNRESDRRFRQSFSKRTLFSEITTNKRQYD